MTIFSAILCVSDELLLAIGTWLQGCIPYWPYDLVARIDVVTRHCNRKKPRKPSNLTQLDVLFSVLALLDTSIGMILLWFQYHIPMIRHLLWPFWANLDRRWTSSTSPERCPCDVVFAQNLAILSSQIWYKTVHKFVLFTPAVQFPFDPWIGLEDFLLSRRKNVTIKQHLIKI